MPVNCAHTPQRTVIAQVAGAVFGGPHSVGFFYIQATTALILVLAANTAFNGFPLLGAILARDKNLPASSTTAATGSPTATASSRWRSSPAS